MLTKEQAIAEHRKMWKWIAEQIEEAKAVLDIWNAKENYLGLQKHKTFPRNDCFLCEYVTDFNDDLGCEICPLETPKMGREIGCLGGLYYKACRAETWQEQAALARQIAELPEREDV